jgi:dTDP-4-dehydrorhamnose reductase
MKKILIVGASGLLGSVLTPKIKSISSEIICVASTINYDIDFALDFSDFEKVTDLLNHVNPDIIVNLAALTDVDLCEKKPHLAYLYNVKILQNIVSWLKNNKNNFLIHLSTDQVYDGVSLNKEEEITITNYYSFSKLMGDIIAQSVNSIILRTNFFGKSNKSNKTSFSDWVIEKLNSKQIINGFEDVFFSPLSMETLSDLILLIIRKPQFGTYNLGSNNGFSKADFISQIAKLFNFPNSLIKYSSINNVKLLANRPKNMMMDNTFFEKSYNLTLPNLIDEINLLKGDCKNEN